MSQPHFEVASGLINGSNKTFTVSIPYAANTTAVFVNGKLYRRDWDDGWTETSPTTGVVDLLEAPLPADVVQIFFTDTAGIELESEVCALQGRIIEIGRVRGVLLDAELRLASLNEFAALDGRLLDIQPLLGTIEDPEVLHARLQEVCH